MNRRSFLSFLGLASIAAVTAGAAAEAATVIGIDGGGPDDCLGVAVLRPCDLTFIAARQFQLEEIARFYRVPPDRIGRLA